MTDAKIAIITCYNFNHEPPHWEGNFSPRPIPEHPLLLFTAEDSQDQRPVSLFIALA
jgi:hypothetical protein